MAYRGRAGSKRHLITDATGIPLAVILTRANRNGEVDGGLDLSASARYVRFLLTWRAAAYGYLLRELSVRA
ncbi:hypothetical protein [Nonomuraea wenchangensis]|uniref:hypothetical protein n=1 Tax=Nonomuraea wenchangensis TaxID=568860 RepID=UPI003F4E19F7